MLDQAKKRVRSLVSFIEDSATNEPGDVAEVLGAPRPGMGCHPCGIVSPRADPELNSHNICGLGTACREGQREAVEAQTRRRRRSFRLTLQFGASAEAVVFIQFTILVRT